jgi:hypothetical protein
MPSARIPIHRRVIDPDPAGPIRTQLQARLTLDALASNGAWIWVPVCLIDTAANYTTFSATWARLYGIPVPDTTSRLPVRTAAGERVVTVRDGQLRVRFPQFPGRVFTLYCVFSEDYGPAAPPLLGLNNFIDVFRVALDGRYSRDAPAGHVALEVD